MCSTESYLTIGRNISTKDPDSWKARSIAKRDAKHIHDGPEVPKPPRNKRKDTKKWCRGKVGVGHKYETVSWPVHASYTSAYVIDKCSECGKETNLRREDTALDH